MKEMSNFHPKKPICIPRFEVLSSSSYFRITGPYKPIENDILFLSFDIILKYYLLFEETLIKDFLVKVCYSSAFQTISRR